MINDISGRFGTAAQKVSGERADLFGALRERASYYISESIGMENMAGIQSLYVVFEIYP